MINNKFIEELSQRLARVIPMAGEVSNEVGSSIKKVLKNTLDEMNVLSQEEFDAQAAVLARAENRISELEQSIAALEAKVESLQGEATRA